MKPLRRMLVLAACVFSLAAASNIYAAGIEYRAVPGFAPFPANAEKGAVSGVGVDSKGRVYVLQRAKPPVLCFDQTGKFLTSFGEDLIGVGHGLSVDPEDNVWVTDTGHHMVFKFSPNGKLLLAVGQTDKPGTESGQFDKPTYVEFGPDREIFVLDGYGNSRIVRCNADGKFLQTWGTRGKGPGDFHSPHAAVVDRRGRLIVCDRDNERIQIFDREGKLLDTWTGYKPFGIAQDGEGTLFVSDGNLQQVLQLGPDGKVVKSWGKEGSGPMEFKTPHLITADRQGNLYIAEVAGKRLQKLERVR